jgi:hypothetical protein
MVRRTMGFDIIGKISGVIDWEIMLKECASAEASVPENAEIDTVLTTLLDDLPLPISIIQRSDGSYVWKWLRASGQSATFMDAMKAALIHVMKSHALIRSELLG